MFSKSLANHHCVHRGMKGRWKASRPDNGQKGEATNLCVTCNPSILKFLRIYGQDVHLSRSLSTHDLQNTITMYSRFYQGVHPSRSTHELLLLLLLSLEVFRLVHASRSLSTQPLPSIHHEVLTNLFDLTKHSDVGYWWIQNPFFAQYNNTQQPQPTQDIDRRSGASTAVKHQTHMTKSFSRAEKRGEQENNSTKCTNS